MTNGSKLTRKQQVFAKQYALTGEKTASAKIAYPTVKLDQTAYNLANKNLQNPKVTELIETILNSSGLGLDNLSGYTHKIIKAGTSRRALYKATTADSLRGIEMAYKLHDSFPAERKIIDKRSLNINYDTQSDEELIKALHEVSETAKHYQELIDKGK